MLCLWQERDMYPMPSLEKKGSATVLGEAMSVGCAKDKLAKGELQGPEPYGKRPSA